MDRIPEMILGGLFLLAAFSYVIYDSMKMINKDLEEKKKIEKLNEELNKETK